jgi:tryptophan-rich sensory protein
MRYRIRTVNTYIVLPLKVYAIWSQPMVTTLDTAVHGSGMRSGLALVGWLALSFTAAAVGGFFLPGEWYARLQKPAWNPPNWIFGPVWTALYTMMAVAAWLVWKRGGFAAHLTALSLFLLQLLINALWSPLFFGLRNPALAFVDIVLLWLALLATVVAFCKIRPLAGGLLVPYLTWVTFASALNFTIWRLNRW